MSVPSKLTGGTLVRRDPARPATSPYTEPPYIRVFDPLDLYASTGCVALLRQAAVLDLHSPDTAWVEVAVREVDGNKYILLAPASSDDPHKQEVSTHPDQSGAFIRTADDVLLAGGIASMPGVSFKMEAGLVEDEALHWVVAGNWTQAKREARSSRGDGAPVPADKAAAARMDGAGS